MTRAERIGLAIAIAIVYAAIAILSFGHAAAHHTCSDDDVKLGVCTGDNVMSGMGAALLWPFYWSWELQS